MKKAGPSFGHIDAGYRLFDIFLRTINDFNSADHKYVKVDEEFKKTKETPLMMQLFELGQARREAGVIAILTAGAFLEEYLYAYAVHHIDVNAYEKHLENVRAISKWILLPKLCQNKTIDEGDARIGDLKKFIQVRNDITHPKRIVINEPISAIEKSHRAEDDFLMVARKLETTVSNARRILDEKTPERAGAVT